MTQKLIDELTRILYPEGIKHPQQKEPYWLLEEVKRLKGQMVDVECVDYKQLYEELLKEYHKVVTDSAPYLRTKSALDTFDTAQTQPRGDCHDK